MGYPAILPAWQHSRPQHVPVPLENAAPLGWVPFGRAQRNYGRARGWAAADDVCQGKKKKGNQHMPGEEKGGGLLLSPSSARLRAQ